MGNFHLFIGNVASHWVYLMGGIAGILIGVVETLRKKPWKGAFWFMATMCLLASTERAWQDEHRNTQVVENEKSALAAANEECKTTSKIDAAYRRGLEAYALTSRQSLDKQQSNVDSCLTTIGKLNPLVIREINVSQVWVASGTNDPQPSTRQTFHLSALAISTTVKTSPVGILHCAKSFLPSSAELRQRTGGMVYTSSPKKIGDNEYEVRVSNTGAEWDATSPIMLSTTSADKSILPCSFKPE